MVERVAGAGRRDPSEVCRRPYRFHIRSAEVGHNFGRQVYGTTVSVCVTPNVPGTVGKVRQRQTGRIAGRNSTRGFT